MLNLFNRYQLYHTLFVQPPQTFAWEHTTCTTRYQTMTQTFHLFKHWLRKHRDPSPRIDEFSDPEAYKAA